MNCALWNQGKCSQYQSTSLPCLQWAFENDIALFQEINVAHVVESVCGIFFSFKAQLCSFF